MPAYLLVMKMPKNPSRFIHVFKERIIELCIEKGEDCVVDHVPGRLVLFSSERICEEVKNMERVMDCHPIRIFEDMDSLISYILPNLDNCSSFAVRSNHLHVAQNIGEILYEKKRIKVDLEAPDCEIKIEYRGGYYFLIEE